MLMEGRLKSVGIFQLIEWLAMASIPTWNNEFFSSSHQQQGFWAPLKLSEGRSGYFPGYKEIKAVGKRRAVK